MSWQENGILTKFNQFEISNDPEAWLDEFGWLYIPNSCVNGGCKLAVIMHGCNEWAIEFTKASKGWTSVGSLNDIIMLFPNSAAFPLKCWDMSNIADRPNFATNLDP